MNLQQAIESYLSDNINKLSDIYTWNFNLKKFPIVDYVASGSNPYERTRNLRFYIHELILKNHKENGNCQKWYVREWGGVKRNKDETLESYINFKDQDILNKLAAGIATWSKILAVRDPNKYAIYDARVALSLNSIQKIYKVESPILFPQLPSQNKSFVKSTQEAITKSGIFRKSPDNFYEIYLDSLSKAVVNTKFDLQDAEMVLFSKSQELSKTWNNEISTLGWDSSFAEMRDSVAKVDGDVAKSG